MTQENQGTGSAVPDNLPAKRKRGRPRKDRSLTPGQVTGTPSSQTPGQAYATPTSQTQGQVHATPTIQTPGQVYATPTIQTPGQVHATPTIQTPGQVHATPTTPAPETEKKNQRQRVESVTDTRSDIVGQPVFGVLDGTFDAGYLITVRVGESNTFLKGVVFQPGATVPITGSNDVAPHIKMTKRAEVSFPHVGVTTLGQGPSAQSVQFSKRPDHTPGRNESFHHSSGSPPVNTAARVPPQLPSQSLLQVIQGGQNNTGYVSQAASITSPQAEVKTMILAASPAEGHYGDFRVEASSHAEDIEKNQPNDILPEHPQPELKEKPASVEDVKQAAPLETKAAPVSEAPSGGGDEIPKSESSTKNMLNQLFPAEDEADMTAGPTDVTMEALGENQTSQVDEQGGILPP